MKAGVRQAEVVVIPLGALVALLVSYVTHKQ